MSDRFRLTLAQLNPTVGDIDGNATQARAAWEAGKQAGANLVALPEMFITGYNTQDLVMKPVFHQSAIAAIEVLARECADGPALCIGGPALEGASLYNAYYILSGGKVSACVLKHHLPNETVFDEERLYDSGPVTGPYTVDGVRIGSPICEDSWYEDVAETLAETSPYYREKISVRHQLMVSRVVETGLPLIYLNLVGAQDDQVFDGGTFALNPGGELAVQMPLMQEGIAHVDMVRGPDGWRIEKGDLAPIPEAPEQDYHAMVLALRDYMRKTGFSTTRPSWPRWLLMHWARRMCAVSCCRRNTPPISRLRMPRRWRRTLAAGTISYRLPRGAMRSPTHLRRCLKAPTPMSPRRISSRACAVCCLWR
jgi:NAD+ synthase